MGESSGGPIEMVTPEGAKVTIHQVQLVTIEHEDEERESILFRLTTDHPESREVVSMFLHAVQTFGLGSSVNLNEVDSSEAAEA